MLILQPKSLLYSWNLDDLSESEAAMASLHFDQRRCAQRDGCEFRYGELSPDPGLLSASAAACSDCFPRIGLIASYPHP